MIEKTCNINNFIGVYDNYITKEDCQKVINIYDAEDKFNHTINRVANEDAGVLYKQDQQFFCMSNNMEIWWERVKPLIYNFDMAWRHYDKMTGAKESLGNIDLLHTTLKIQKTLPGEGYHLWHIEYGKGFDNECRAFVFSIYLNDIEEGGETEFLHFSKRVRPKTGRIVIWPAGFPYLHRGNPPLSGEKYILTSWLTVR